MLKIRLKYLSGLFHFEARGKSTYSSSTAGPVQPQKNAKPISPTSISPQVSYKIPKTQKRSVE